MEFLTLTFWSGSRLFISHITATSVLRWCHKKQLENLSHKVTVYFRGRWLRKNYFLCLYTGERQLLLFHHQKGEKPLLLGDRMESILGSLTFCNVNTSLQGSNKLQLFHLETYPRSLASYLQSWVNLSGMLPLYSCKLIFQDLLLAKDPKFSTNLFGKPQLCRNTKLFSLYPLIPPLMFLHSCLLVKFSIICHAIGHFVLIWAAVARPKSTGF